MRRNTIGKVLLVALLTAGVAVCGKKDLEEETEDVLEEQQEAANRAVRTPEDTAAIRREAQDVEEEQKDVQEAMKEELKEKNIPATTTSNQ